MNEFVIKHKTQADDGIGGLLETWMPFKTVYGYLDMMTGTDLAGTQNAIIEQSTHVLILPTYTEGITDDMQLFDSAGRYYTITYVDDPMGVHHHVEIYCKYGGVANG